MTAPDVVIDGQTMRLDFNAFDLESYRKFLLTKSLPESTLTFDWERDTYRIEAASRFAPLLGIPDPQVRAERMPLAAHLFDYQAWAVGLALDARRFALWCDTGLGKTAMYLEWAKQVTDITGGRVLILAPLAVIPQTIAEARRFYDDGEWSYPIVHLRTREELATWCEHGGVEGVGYCEIGICNYEKFSPGTISELRYLAGLVADESSILKTGGGKIKWNLIKSARGIEYKLSCSATPAPNEVMEYASQAAFLEKLRSEGDILWTWFTRDKRGEWSIKPHAREAFYRFMASWSLYMRDPAAFGFGDILADLPDPVMHEERIPLTDEQRSLMQEMTVRSGKGLWADERLGVKERSKFAQLARGFLYEGTGKDRTIRPVTALKPTRVAAIVIREVLAGHQVLVWTTFDEEGEIIADLMPEAREGGEVAILTGSQSPDDRQSILDRFRSGSIRCLISKPSLIGYGLNLQFVTSMIFSGVDDSMERRYQAVRRAYRFGQTQPVHVWTPYCPELEGTMFDNVAAKEARFLADVATQERHYRRALGMEVVT